VAYGRSVWLQCATSASPVLSNRPCHPLPPYIAPMLQRGHLPRGVVLSQDDLSLIKAFDRDGDGVLSEKEMDLAQAAFRARAA
jgi:hypothetical protein